MNKFFLMVSLALLIAATLTGLTATPIQMADAKGQCKEPDSDGTVKCSGGIGFPPNSGTSGGTGGHQEFESDGDQTNAGGRGVPGANDELSNGFRCDTEEQRCVGDGFDSGSGND